MVTKISDRHMRMRSFCSGGRWYVVINDEQAKQTFAGVGDTLTAAITDAERHRLIALGAA